MKWFSLFSGIGGFDLALQRQGHKVVGACEIDRHSRAIYARHFPGVKIWHDATKINPKELPDFEGMCAGFPCEAFTVAGKRLGFEESRGTVFFEIARIAKEKRPRLLLLENVKGLLSHDRGKTFAVILAVLDELGYDAQWQMLNSKYWVPQNRERIFIIANLRGTPRPKVFPVRQSDEETDKEIKDGQEREIVNCIDSNYWKGADNHGQRTLVQIGNIDQKDHNSIWGRVYDPEGISSTLNAHGGGLGAKTGLYAIPVLTPSREKKTQNGRRFKEPGEDMFTLTSQDIHGVSDGIRVRRLTPLECERLQGFPDLWTDIIIGKSKAGFDNHMSDTQRYQGCGKAVTVPVIEFILKRL